MDPVTQGVRMKQLAMARRLVDHAKSLHQTALELRVATRALRLKARSIRDQIVQYQTPERQPLSFLDVLASSRSNFTSPALFQVLSNARTFPSSKVSPQG